MATLIFLLAHWLGRVESPYDTYAFTLLLALDSSTGLRWWIWHRSHR